MPGRSADLGLAPRLDDKIPLNLPGDAVHETDAGRRVRRQRGGDAVKNLRFARA